MKLYYSVTENTEKQNQAPVMPKSQKTRNTFCRKSGCLPREKKRKEETEAYSSASVRRWAARHTQVPLSPKSTTKEGAGAKRAPIPEEISRGDYMISLSSFLDFSL